MSNSLGRNNTRFSPTIAASRSASARSTGGVPMEGAAVEAVVAGETVTLKKLRPGALVA